VVVAFVVVVLAMAVTVVVVFVVPVSLVELPALLVVVIVGMIPVGSFVGRTVPASLNPAIVVTIGGPISLNPGVAGAGHWSAGLDSQGRWRRSDVNPETWAEVGTTIAVAKNAAQIKLSFNSYLPFRSSDFQ
jgi:hypothetical protein